MMSSARAPPPLSIIHGDVKFLLNDVPLLPDVMLQLSAAGVASRCRSLPYCVADLSGAVAELLGLLSTKNERHHRSLHDALYGARGLLPSGLRKQLQDLNCAHTFMRHFTAAGLRDLVAHTHDALDGAMHDPVSGTPDKDQDLLGWDKGNDKGYDKGYDKSHDKGFDKGSDKVFDKGFVKGFDKGSGKGFDKGYDKGYDKDHVCSHVGPGESYDKGYDKGYDMGNDKGFDKSHDKGFDKGSHKGFGQGFDNGFGKGPDMGFDKGYDEGYDKDHVSSHIGPGESYDKHFGTDCRFQGKGKAVHQAAWDERQELKKKEDEMRRAKGKGKF